METRSVTTANLATCKGCGRKMFWGKTAEGKSIPLDASAPVYLLNHSSGVAERVHDIFVSHFSTCPKAGDFSKGGKKQ